MELIDFKTHDKEEIEKTMFAIEHSVLFYRKKWPFDVMSYDQIIEEIELVRNKESDLSSMKRQIIRFIDIHCYNVIQAVKKNKELEEKNAR